MLSHPPGFSEAGWTRAPEGYHERTFQMRHREDEPFLRKTLVGGLFRRPTQVFTLEMEQVSASLAGNQMELLAFVSQQPRCCSKYANLEKPGSRSAQSICSHLRGAGGAEAAGREQPPTGVTLPRGWPPGLQLLLHPLLCTVPGPAPETSPE